MDSKQTEKKMRNSRIASMLSTNLVLLITIIFAIFVRFEDNDLQLNIYKYLLLFISIVFAFMNNYMSISSAKRSRRLHMMGNAQIVEGQDIIGALTSHYIFASYNDFVTGEMRIVQLNGRSAPTFNHDQKSKHPFEWYIEQYANKAVAESDRQMFMTEVNSINLQHQLETQNVYSFTYEAIIDGRPNYCEMRAIKVNGNNSKVIICLIDVDRTVRANIENNKILAAGLEQVRRANEAKNVFMASMSHEMRTPLNSVIGLADMLATDEFPEDVRQYADNISSSGKQLLYMVDNITNLNMIRNGEMILENSEMSLRALCDSVVAQAKALSESLERPLNTEVNISDAFVNCDMARYGMAVMHVVENAFKFSKATDPVDLKIVSKLNFDNTVRLEVTVRDYGVGIKKEEIERIFAPFEKEASSTETGIFGAGVGLSITRSIIELMDGFITIDSSKGDGTTVVITVALTTA